MGIGWSPRSVYLLSRHTAGNVLGVEPGVIKRSEMVKVLAIFSFWRVYCSYLFVRMTPVSASIT